MNKRISIRIAFKKFDAFITMAKLRARKNPLIVTMLMHEYFRNIYPADPCIPKRFSSNHLQNIIICLDRCIQTFKQTDYIGTYFDQKRKLPDIYKDSINPKDHGIGFTQKVYGRLWKKLTAEYICCESTEVLKRTFLSNGFDPKYLRGKKVMDMGCGSGRFTIAFAKLGAAHVVGVDLGQEGIKIGKRMVRELKLRNVDFIKHSVLELPFPDASFDFVYCKGVLHHTGNLKCGLDELYRVLKHQGRAFLYLYADGGLFWYSRNKMREVMRLIPIDYAINVLDLLGMPSKRYIFVDSWYVPIEEHTPANKLESYLRRQGYTRIERIKRGSSIELESVVFSNTLHAKEIWGDGELRYFLYK